MLMRRTHVVTLIALLCLVGLNLGTGSRIAWSEESKSFPPRQLTYIVCFDPGGQSDREARRQTPLLEKFLGQKVIIDYKIGGGGALGWRELTKAKPDGYTIAGFNIPHVILQPLQQDVGYKTEQIVPLFIFHKTPLALAVLETSPFKTLKDLVDHAKKNPYLVAVFGASDDLTRYRDKVRILGFATEKRFPGFPEEPTLKEQGFDMVEGVDRGVAVPPGTPPDVIKKLEAAFMDIASKPEFQEEQRKNGFIPLAIGHEEGKEYLKRMTALYTEIFAEVKKR